MSIGAYTFVTEDWREKEYPLDLWIEWNSKYFDQLSVVVFGKLNMKMVLPTNVVVKHIDELPHFQSFDLYIKGKYLAQIQLNTDWKVALDSDEFISKRIDTTYLNKRYVYAIKEKHLFGNLETEILKAFPEFHFRIHYGNRKLLRDGANVKLPIFLRLINYQRVVYFHIFKKEDYKGVFIPHPYFEVWHTNACRTPSTMSRKWREQIEREIKEGRRKNENRLKILNKEFDYHQFKMINKNAILKRIFLDEIPEILRSHKERFNQLEFEQSEYQL